MYFSQLVIQILPQLSLQLQLWKILSLNTLFLALTHTGTHVHTHIYTYEHRCANTPTHSPACTLMLTHHTYTRSHAHTCRDTHASPSTDAIMLSIKYFVCVLKHIEI